MQALSDESQEMLKSMRLQFIHDFPAYAKACLKIRPKDANPMAFTLKRAQKYIHDLVQQQLKETGKVRAIILKGRQMGASTLISGRFYWRVTNSLGLQAFILTHEEAATNNLFNMAKRFHENCPIYFQPAIKSSNAKELVFGGLDAGYKLGTAGNKTTGRSQTIQLLHASEAAFYDHTDEHTKGILQAVPMGANTEIFIESTANGVGNWFHEKWQQAESGEGEYIPIFTPWYWDDDYQINVPEDFQKSDEEKELTSLYMLSDKQLAWRRLKIKDFSGSGMDGDKGFKQEYPCNPTEAFVMSGEDAFIPANLVMQARKQTCEKYGPLIIGCDPARFGDDRTAIIRRKGRVAYNLQTYKKKDTMEIVGLLVSIIQSENPVKVLIDVGGLGAGIVDRLHELGYRDLVIGINSSTAAIESDKYANKRAEMWAQTKLWLQNAPVQIPDSNELHADLCNSKYKPSSNGALLIESKESMKKRGVRSSDTADALILTHALPISAYANKSISDKQIAQKITSVSRKVASIRKTGAAKYY